MNSDLIKDSNFIQMNRTTLKRKEDSKDTKIKVTNLE